MERGPPCRGDQNREEEPKTKLLLFIRRSLFAQISEKSRSPPLVESSSGYTNSKELSCFISVPASLPGTRTLRVLSIFLLQGI